MEKWLLVYKYQAPGLKNCIQLLSQEVEVEAYVFSQFQKVAAGLKSKFDQYDQIIVAPKLANPATVHFSDPSNLLTLTPIFFRSADRSAGKACISKCKFRWSPY